MVNVLHVISDTNIGGAGMHLKTLVKFLDKSKFRIFVACPKNADIVSILDASDVKIIEIVEMEGNKSFSRQSILALKKVIKNNKIDIVHTHASLTARIAAKLSGAKIVYTRHTPGEVYKRNSLKWLLNKYLNIFLCDKVIAVSKFIEHQLKEFGLPEDKIVTIYNGLDIAEFEKAVDCEEIKQRYNLQDNFIILETARIEEGKGHRFLLEAASKLPQNIKYKIIFVGDGSKRQEVKNYSVELNIEDKVIFTGTIKDVKSVISISDIVVLPSLFEALGLALIEGMCMSKPCIGTNVDGIPEVIQDGISGILVEPKNIECLKDAIIKLHDNLKLRDKMGHEGKKIAAEKFNAEIMARKVEQLYEKLV